MSDQDFEKMDQQWMKSTQELREKKVSDGILKGFSASVERRLAAKEEAPRRVRALAWAPALAVMVIASAIALRSPQTVDYAQLPEEDSINEEISALKEVGAWSEADDALLGTDEETMEDLELSDLGGNQANIA